MIITELQPITELMIESIDLFVAAFCMSIGILLKHSCSKIPNFCIPGILAFIGIAFAAWTFKSFTPKIVLTGISSAVFACGIHGSGKNTYLTFKEFVEAMMKKYKTKKLEE